MFILGLDQRLGREEQRLRIWKDFPLGFGWGPDFATSGSHCVSHPAAAEGSRFGNQFLTETAFYLHCKPKPPKCSEALTVPRSSCSLPSITFSKKTCASVSPLSTLLEYASATPLGDMALGKTLHYPHLYICVCTRTYTYTHTQIFFQEIFHYHRYSLQHCFVTTGYKSIRPPLNLLICYLHFYSLSRARLAKMQFFSHLFL